MSEADDRRTVPGGGGRGFRLASPRTALVLGTLFAVLYAGLVLLATQVLTVKSPVAVAVATLATAALFNPVRRRVQRIVDRRFNRARHDAERTIDAFAAGLQGAVDLDSVRDGLVSAVHRALEPAHVSVWVRDRGPSRVSSVADVDWNFQLAQQLDGRVVPHVERLVQAGASLAWRTDDVRGSSVTLYDPEGNEFCVT